MRLDVSFTVSSQYITSHPVKGQLITHLFPNICFFKKSLFSKTTFLRKNVSKLTCYETYSDPSMLNKILHHPL